MCKWDGSDAIEKPVSLKKKSANLGGIQYCIHR